MRSSARAPVLYSRPSGWRIARSYVSLESKGKGTEGVLNLALFLLSRAGGGGDKGGGSGRGERRAGRASLQAR